MQTPEPSISAIFNPLFTPVTLNSERLTERPKGRPRRRREVANVTVNQISDARTAPPVSEELRRELLRKFKLEMLAGLTPVHAITKLEAQHGLSRRQTYPILGQLI